MVLRHKYATVNATVEFRHDILLEFGGKWETECLNTMFPLLSLCWIQGEAVPTKPVQEFLGKRPVTRTSLKYHIGVKKNIFFVSSW